jgi:hypothetical protein
LTGDLYLGSTLMIKTHPHRQRSNSSWYRHPIGLSQAWGSAAVSHHHLLLIYFSSRVISWIEKLSYRIVCSVAVSSLVGYLCIPWCELR